MAFDSVLSDALSGHSLELSLYDNSGKVANFYPLERDIVAAMRHAGEDAAQETYLTAYQLCAVATGFMREKLQIVRSPEGQTWEIGWEAVDFISEGKPFYPMFVVLGTRHMAANDPLTPAYALTKGKYAEKIHDLVQLAVERRRMRAA